MPTSPPIAKISQYIIMYIASSNPGKSQLYFHPFNSVLRNTSTFQRSLYEAFNLLNNSNLKQLQIFFNLKRSKLKNFELQARKAQERNFVLRRRTVFGMKNKKF